MVTEVPANAEQVAVIDALRQAYALIEAQRPFITDEVTKLDEALSTIRALAEVIKGQA